MDVETARSIAYVSHGYRRDRFGELEIEHVARVAARVPPPARSTAWLHDAVEQGAITAADLRAKGLTDEEAAALGLLIRGPGESFELHLLRVVHAPGAAADLARAVRLADFDDHLAQAAADRQVRDLPPLAWGRRHLAAAVVEGAATGSVR